MGGAHQGAIAVVLTIVARQDGLKKRLLLLLFSFRMWILIMMMLYFNFLIFFLYLKIRIRRGLPADAQLILSPAFLHKPYQTN